MIGVGMVADTHWQALRDLSPGLYLRGVLASSRQSSQAFIAKHCVDGSNRPACYASIDELVADRQIGMAIVLTPPNARLALVERLVAANIPILLEKPVERDSRRAALLVSLCEAAKVPLGVVFQHRVRKASLELARLIASDVFGQLGLVEVNVPWWRDQAYYNEPGRGTYDRDGGGVLISQAIHTLDLMLSLVGNVVSVQAMASTTRFHSMESEDYVSASMVFANGAIGSMTASTASFPGDAESITLHFDNVVVELKSGVLEIRWRDGSIECFGDTANTGGGADPMAFTHTWHRDVIKDFANAVSDSRPPLVTGREALQVHRLIDAMILSSANGERVSL